MSDVDVADRGAELTAAYETAVSAERAARGTPDHPAARASLDTARAELITERRYWREVGEAVGAFVDRAHDGARVERVKVRNNDGSV